MPTLTSVTKYFITAQEGFTTTTAGSVASGAATVTLNSVSGYTNGDQVAFVIDPTDVTKKQVFTGTIDTSGVQVTNVVWTEGTNQTHAAGATVVDYTTATHQAAMVKGVKVSLDDDGTLKAGAVDNSAAIADGVVSTAKIADAAVTPAKLGDSGWLSLTGASGFTSSGAQYRKIGNVVYLRGQIDKNSGNVASSETLTTIPADFRPTTAQSFAGIGAGPAFTKMLVNTTGTIVTASTPTSTTAYMRLDNVIYTVD